MGVLNRGLHPFANRYRFILRPLMRAEVFDSFCFLLTGLLVGEAKHGTVRASVFASAEFQP